MRKIFLDDLPKKGKRINWKNSIGHKINFTYDNIKGEFKIVDYDTQGRKVSLLYKNEISKIYTGDLMDVKISKILGIRTSDFKFEIEDKIDNLILINKEYRIRNRINNHKEKQKWYKYHCLICENEDWIEENNLKKGRRCNVCCDYPQKVLKGYNDIATTSPWMVDLGVSEEDAILYTSRSNKTITVKCPNCGKEKHIAICDIYKRRSIGCLCGDGVSYPEKFLISLLNQLNIKYNKEYKTNWSNNKRYDFYLPDYNCVIETHGEQHYNNNNSFNLYGNRSFEEELENDKIKKQLALSNGINKYIVLDCRESNLDWIKNSILNSELNSMFNLNIIDWMECEKFALSNRVKEICDYWNQKEDWETVTTIGNKFNIYRHTIRNYLIRGSKLGWCSYDAKEEMRKNMRKNNKNGKRVKILKDDECLGIFESAYELERQSEELFEVKLMHTAISAVCNGKRNHHKGFTFKYVESSDINASK